MNYKQGTPLHITLAVSPVFTLALAMTLPLVLVESSWGQMPTSNATDILYYGWYHNDEPAKADPTTSDVATSDVVTSKVTTLEVTKVATSEITTSEITTPDTTIPDAIISDTTIPDAIISDTTIPDATIPDAAVELAQTPSDFEIAPEASPVFPDRIAPIGAGQIITDIQVRFLDPDGQIVEGHTRPSVFTRELELQTGESYDPAIAQEGLDRILALNIVRDADIELEPATDPDQVTLVLLVVERRPFIAALGVYSPSPSALEGPFQQNPVLGAGNNESTGFSADGNLQLLNIGGNDQSLIFQLRGGERVFDTELSFTDPWIGNDPTGITVNVFNQRSVQGVFTDGERDVDLPNGNTPWVHRLGGGVQVFRPLASDLTVALGTNYQRVSVHNSAFETETFTRDELGERLVVSDSGYDDLLTVNFSADLDRRNDPEDPTRGSRFRFGLDQAIPIGDANIKFTRFSANYVQFVPLNLFGFAEGARTLVLNLQAGTILGDVPPYEAFNLSSGPLGDYSGDSFGTGSSFALLGAEYRFPIANFNLFRQNVRLGGHLFGGYATTLGTDNEVIGEPSISRDKPGDGWSYGIGLRAGTDYGLLRLEFGLNDSGESQVIFSIGDRF